ncbi:MAG: hypothetical protein J6T87_07360 [Bacteroidales bacterium]|jgi:hypothetical protein|nr:hypothetical protein [Bacteroidales bacterium]
MKKLLTTIVMLALTVGAIMAQPKAIGGRVGYNFEVSYQHTIGDGMLEVDAGFSPFITSTGVMITEDGDQLIQRYQYGRAELILAYDWVMNIKSGFYWYLGVTAGLSWGYGDFFNFPHYDKHGKLVQFRRLGLPAGAQIGLEYDFNIPLNLSVDWRPMINLFGLRQGDFTSNLLNVALGVRYRF